MTTCSCMDVLLRNRSPRSGRRALFRGPIRQGWAPAYLKRARVQGRCVSVVYAVRTSQFAEASCILPHPKLSAMARVEMSPTTNRAKPARLVSVCQVYYSFLVLTRDCHTDPAPSMARAVSMSSLSPRKKSPPHSSRFSRRQIRSVPSSSPASWRVSKRFTSSMFR
jgi:hypothetical protein